MFTIFIIEKASQCVFFALQPLSPVEKQARTGQGVSLFRNRMVVLSLQADIIAGSSPFTVRKLRRARVQLPPF